MNNTADNLKNNNNVIEELHQKVLELQSENEAWKLKYQSLLESFKLAQLNRYGSSSEKNIHQADLFDEADCPVAAEEETATITTVAEHERKKDHPKRVALPADLPREIVEHDISDEEKKCACGCIKKRFGEDASEQLDIIPPQVKVIRHIRPKYVCTACEGSISIAAMPVLLLPKSIASAGLIAYAITAKYVDHIPLYRQESIWKRHGVSIPRNSHCTWLMKVAELCEPLWQRLKVHICAGNYIQADETPLQVMKEPGRDNRRRSYMWLYRGGPPEKMATFFDYQETREAKHAQQFLKLFTGYLQTDAYVGYDWADRSDELIHLGCMAHARRPFAESIKISKKAGKSHQIVALIAKLYQLEKAARDQHLSATERHALRLEKAKPILDKIKIWLDKSVHQSPPKSKLGKAIHYMLNHWEALTNYLRDGILEIDNNRIENNIRPFAVGRKNWLFAGSPRGAKAGAIFYSLIKTAQANDVEPYKYFRFILERIRCCKTDDDYDQLLPWNCPGM